MKGLLGTIKTSNQIRPDKPSIPQNPIRDLNRKRFTNYALGRVWTSRNATQTMEGQEKEAQTLLLYHFLESVLWEAPRHFNSRVCFGYRL